MFPPLNWFEIPNDFIDEGWPQKLSPTGLHIMLVLFRRENGYPAQEGAYPYEIASITKEEPERVQAALIKLQELGLVTGNSDNVWKVNTNG